MNEARATRSGTSGTVRQAGLVFFALALAVALAAFFYVRRNFERVEETVDVGFRGAAARNRFLALERLANALGMPAHSRTGFWQMPEVDATLVLFSQRAAANEPQAARLLDWVRAGGRLVVTPARARAGDPLLKAFDVVVVRAAKPPRRQADGDDDDDDEADLPNGDAAGGLSKASPGPGGLELVEVSLPGTGSTAKLELPAGDRLGPTQRPNIPTLSAPSGIFLHVYKHGLGEVLVLSDAGLLTNRHLGARENARLACWLLGRCDPSVLTRARMTLVYLDEMPSLFRVLLKEAWMGLLSLGILLAAWLLRAGARFGPVLPDPPRDRRSLLEHIEAAGDYLVRTGRTSDLLDACREALANRLSRVRPDLYTSPNGGLQEPALHPVRLAALAGLPASRVARALDSSLDPNPADFTDAVRVLETIRRSL